MHLCIRLQRAQNATSGAPIGDQQTLPTGLLEQLHWLPIEWRIKLRIACITYKTVFTTQPAYLHSVLKHSVPSRT